MIPVDKQVQNQAPSTVGVISLGCNKNRVDAEVMLARLQECGYKLVQDPAQAEILIVNTCGFIRSAKEEALDTIFEMADYKTKGNCKILIAAGCLTERYADQLAEEMPEVDAILGIAQYHRIDQAVNEVLQGKRPVWVGDKQTLLESHARVQTTPQHFAYLKIAEGCDNRCTYCAIPGIRGPYRSRPIDALVKEAQQLAASGVKELVVVAQDTTRYGSDRPQSGETLVTLLRALCRIEGLRWVRILYAYPEMVDEALLNTILEEPKLCRYLDIPIQHSADAVLRRMNRRSSGQQIRDLVTYIRSLPQPFALRTTAIAGFPGETDEDFQNLLAFIQEYPFDHMGAFAYSQEEDTPAANMQQVPEEIKQKRADRLMALQQKVSGQQKQKRVGTQCEVLVERKLEDGRYAARSMYEAPEVDGCIIVKADRPLEPGSFVNVRITGAADYDLLGELLHESA